MLQRETIITPIAPFDFDLTLGVYASFRSQKVEIYLTGCFERVLLEGGRSFLLTLRSMGTIEEPAVSISVFPPADDVKTSEIVTTVEWMLGARESLQSFYEVAESDTALLAVVKRLRGLKPPRTPTVFEALIIAILEQQVSLSAASTVRGRLAERFGQHMVCEGHQYVAFPTPEALSRAQFEELRALGVTPRKAFCILEISKRVNEGGLDLETLAREPFHEIMRDLNRLKGIGPWTVEYMMCRGMGRYDALPANDTGLKAAVSRFYQTGGKPSEKTVRGILDRLGQYKGYGAFYLIFAYSLEKYQFDPRILRSQIANTPSETKQSLFSNSLQY